MRRRFRQRHRRNADSDSDSDSGAHYNAYAYSYTGTYTGTHPIAADHGGAVYGQSLKHDLRRRRPGGRWHLLRTG